VRLIFSDFLPLSASRRQRIERTIEALIAMLDQMEADVDLEPWLGWTDAANQDSFRWLGGDDDIEAENEHGGDVLDGAGGPEWSSDPKVPQEGYGWHFHDNGGAIDRNPIGASA
jgi:hypothetical protein